MKQWTGRAGTWQPGADFLPRIVRDYEGAMSSPSLAAGSNTTFSIHPSPHSKNADQRVSLAARQIKRTMQCHLIRQFYQ
jgi:hypothetical protein